MTSIRTLTKVCCTAPCKQIQPWLADAPQSFMHFQAAALEYSHRVEGNTGWCTTSQSHHIPHCKPTHSCNPMQFCVCVSTLPSRRKGVLECLIQFHSNFQHGADNRAVIRVLPANLSHTSSDTALGEMQNARRASSTAELDFGKCHWKSHESFLVILYSCDYLAAYQKLVWLSDCNVRDLVSQHHAI